MSEIRVGIIGVGNCCSSLVQGVVYYKDRDADIPGLITKVIGGYYPKDIKFVSAFDIDKRKVGKDISEAIFAKPNCTTIFQPKVDKLGCKVDMGYLLDGVAKHVTNYPIDWRFDPLADIYKSDEEAKKGIVKILKDTKTEVVVNYLPVGSENAARFYAECCLEARCAFVNAMPVFVSKFWGDRFKEAGLPILGDDIKVRSALP